MLFDLVLKNIFQSFKYTFNEIWSEVHVGKRSLARCPSGCVEICSINDVLASILGFWSFPISKWRLFQIKFDVEWCHGWKYPLIPTVVPSPRRNEMRLVEFNSENIHWVTSPQLWPNFQCKINSFANFLLPFSFQLV